ncbi:MAG: hypothetical protein QM606_05015, partial [Leucobacter sp.]
AGLMTSRIARAASDSARSVIWSATSPDIEQGVFVGPDLKRRKTVLRVAQVRGAAADPAFQAGVSRLVHQLAPA